MKEEKILRYLFLSFSILFFYNVSAIRASNVEIETDSVVTSNKEHSLKGFALSFDMAGFVLAQISPYGNIEGALRLNLKNKYFPVVETGIGLSDHTNEETQIHYKTSSPFYRVGLDYNFLKNKSSGNRLFGGARLAFTTFKYDLDAPNLKDPYWGTSTPFVYHNISSNATWIEFVFGIETAVFKNVHLGWNVRYKRRISHKENSLGNTWYIPGYGRNNKGLFTGAFNIIFDI